MNMKWDTYYIAEISGTGIIVSAFTGMEFITLYNPVIGWEFCVAI